MATYKVKSEGKQYTVTVSDKATGGGTVKIEDREFEVEFIGEDSPSPTSAAAVRPPAAAMAQPQSVSAASSPASAPTIAPAGDGSIVAPIPGKVIKINVKVGDPVSVHQVLLTLEAMKMENDIASPTSGAVQQISVSEGSEATAGQILMVVS